VVAADHDLTEAQGRAAVAAVFTTLRKLVPEEAADVASVLPGEIREYWQTAGSPR